MGTYLYGFARWPLPRDVALGSGVGEPPRTLEILPYQDVLALVSTVDEDQSNNPAPRALRRDMKAHAAVLNRLILDGKLTVLPCRFGIIFPNDESIVAQILKPQRAWLRQSLDQLEGTIELTLRATYLEPQVLEEVVREYPQLATRSSGMQRRGRSYQGRIELGRHVAAALRSKREQDAKWLLGVLRPLVRDVKMAEPINDMMLLNASLLVERKSLPAVDEMLDQLHQREYHRIRLDCVGPLPPYSFVNVAL
jgi:hypothetical protein